MSVKPRRNPVGCPSSGGTVGWHGRNTMVTRVVRSDRPSLRVRSLCERSVSHLSRFVTDPIAIAFGEQHRGVKSLQRCLRRSLPSPRGLLRGRDGGSNAHRFRSTASPPSGNMQRRVLWPCRADPMHSPANPEPVRLRRMRRQRAALAASERASHRRAEFRTNSRA